MKRKVGFLIGLVGLVVLVVGGMKVVGGRSPKQGVLKVNSVPTAGIFLGNKHIGRTPYEEKTDVGEYTIKLVPESTVQALASWQESISLAPNLLTYINANLAESEFTTAVDVLWLEKISSKVSEISITTNPDGATVAVDGETRGITPVSLTNVSAADHTLTVTSPGFLTRTLKVKTTAGYKLNASIKLALSPESGTPAEATPTPTMSLTPTPTKTTKPATPSASVANPPKPFVIVKDTPTGFLRVRMEPSTAATEAARVYPGEKYTISDTKSGWYQIKYDGKNTGWISGQYAEKVE